MLIHRKRTPGDVVEKMSCRKTGAGRKGNYDRVRLADLFKVIRIGKKQARGLSLIMAVITLAVFTASCTDNLPTEPVSEEGGRLIKAELQDRSFRQFQPSREDDPRKAFILDFSEGVRDLGAVL